MMGATVATGALASACSSSDSDDTSSGGAIPVAGTNVRDVPVGFLGNAGGRVLLGRDAGGLYAMTSVCTHNQCDMIVYGSIDAAGLNCKCHGSGFSRTGERTRGPAIAALQHFKVDVAADGTITIDSKTAVDAAARTAVPG